jgi:dGTPase
VRLVDRIAYINHDIDDALRAGVLRFEDLPAAEIELLGSTGSERIETLVRDLLERSEAEGDVVQGEEVGGAMLRLREFLFENVYLAADAQREKPRIERVLRALFDHYAGETGDEQAVVDWLAGMTDRYAVRAFAELSLPQGF